MIAPASSGEYSSSGRIASKRHLAMFHCGSGIAARSGDLLAPVRVSGLAASKFSKATQRTKRVQTCDEDLESIARILTGVAGMLKEVES